MKRVLITGAGSYVGESVKKYIQETASDQIEIESVDTFGDNWKKADYTKFDVVYHVAGIAEVNNKKGSEQLYYKVNTDLTIEIAKWAKEHGVKQFIFMSSMIVYKETRSLKGEVITPSTPLAPNGVYGDSKRKAEEGLLALCSEGSEGSESSMKICILRPPMIYGPNSKSNLLKLGWLGTKTPVFPNWRNKRSNLYIDNLAEFVKQVILREMDGILFPQNKEQPATVDIIRHFAKRYNHGIWITKLLNPFVWMGSFVLQPINKMFADFYYEPSMSEYDFDYQLVSFEESLKRIEIK